MPSIRLSAVAVLIMAILPLAGCAYPQDAGWPAGTEAVVSAHGAGSVTAFVPKDQQAPKGRQAKVPLDSVMLGSQTPVVIVDDRGVRLIRVRIAKGDRAGTEVLVRRWDLAPPPDPDAWAISFLPTAVLLLFAAAGVLWTFETVVLLILRMRSGRTELHLGTLPLQTLATLFFQARRRSRLVERTDEDCERWREWIAEKTARRKAICARLRARRLHNGSGVG